jgi:DNA-binding SARP family transcriptional activator
MTKADAPATGPVRLRLLGAPRLELPDGTARALERRGAALLAMLALHGPTPRARAAATIWPDVEDSRAGNSLRQRMFKLRQAAGRDVIVPGRLLTLASDIVHDLAPPLPRLELDPDSCQGGLLGDLDFSDCSDLDAWVGVARQRWRDEVGRSLAALSSRLEGEGRIAAALRLAERLIEIEPIQEHAHRRVMRLHYLRGDRAAALAAFDRCRVVLRGELGVLPDRETQALEQLIAQGDP